MKQLELKHIAPYLPYDLKVIITYYSEKGIMQLEKLSKYRVWVSNGGSIHLWQEQYIDKIKPILRPLSDLFNLIDWDGNNDPYMLGYKYRIEKVTEEGRLIYADEHYADYCESPKCYIDITSFNWWLFEYHFDVFGLIDSGLAIDINTIK